MCPGRGQPLDLMDIVLGRQLARPGLLEVSESVDARRSRAVERVIAIVARVIRGEGRDGAGSGSRAGCGSDNRCDGSTRPLHPAGAGCRRRRSRRLGHLERGERDQTIGTQQKMVLKRRLVDLCEEGILVRAVGARGVQVLGPLGERAVDGVAVASPPGRDRSKAPRRIPPRARRPAKQKTSPDVEPLDRPHA
jgi:hypothetical protein